MRQAPKGNQMRYVFEQEHVVTYYIKCDMRFTGYV